MVQLLISILAFIVAISILVGVHEFGHFWVARRFGIIAGTTNLERNM